MVRRGWDTSRSREIARRAMTVEHATLAAALVAALSELTVVEAARTANIPMKGGGQYSYKYADLPDAVKLTRPVLASHGVVALTPVHDHGDGLACTVILLHESGDKLELGPFPFPHGANAQATGSMVTYHRRYALVAALGMAAGDDDDGASAAPRSSASSTAGGERMCDNCKEPIGTEPVKSLGGGKYVHKACVEPEEVAGGKEAGSGAGADNSVLDPDGGTAKDQPSPLPANNEKAGVS